MAPVSRTGLNELSRQTGAYGTELYSTLNEKTLQVYELFRPWLLVTDLPYVVKHHDEFKWWRLPVLHKAWSISDQHDVGSHRRSQRRWRRLHHEIPSPRVPPPHQAIPQLKQGAWRRHSEGTTSRQRREDATPHLGEEVRSQPVPVTAGPRLAGTDRDCSQLPDGPAGLT